MTDALDETAVAAVALVSDHDVVEGRDLEAAHRKNQTTT
jgi:hypothetical protein